jgi:hypothetical protein
MHQHRRQQADVLEHEAQHHAAAEHAGRLRQRGAVQLAEAVHRHVREQEQQRDDPHAQQRLQGRAEQHLFADGGGDADPQRIQAAQVQPRIALDGPGAGGRIGRQLEQHPGNACGDQRQHLADQQLRQRPDRPAEQRQRLGPAEINDGRGDQAEDQAGQHLRSEADRGADGAARRGRVRRWGMLRSVIPPFYRSRMAPLFPVFPHAIVRTKRSCRIGSSFLQC